MYYCVCCLYVQKPENTPNVAVGELIALIVESGADWKNVAVPEVATVPATEVTSAAPPTPVSYVLSLFPLSVSMINALCTSVTLLYFELG